MARFVTRHGNAVMTAREEMLEHYATGQHRVIQRPLTIQFAADGLSDRDYETARARLVFPGLPEDRERGGDVDPRPRMGVFDSDIAARGANWSDEETALVVEFLREHQWNGIALVEVEPLRAARPWPRYDETPPDLVVETANQIGVPLEDVLTYEQENANREEVCRLLAGELSQREEAEVIVSA